jgi:hypothetical protein
MTMRIMRAAILLALAGAASPALALTCPHTHGFNNPNKLYVYMPAVDDPTYPEFGFPPSTPSTSPAHRFDAAELPSYTGTTADLRNAVTHVVQLDYCEFNVEVLQTTTAPPATYARRNTVAVGTDSAYTYGVLFGMAQNVDTGDVTAIDFARDWVGTYQDWTGGPGGQLNGVSSTLDRWAYSIGGTAAHEAGHNYGLAHGDGLPLAAGEDVLVHHLMASGSHYSAADRANYRRHFSDHEFSVLATNVGLDLDTMWNWDMTNPNAQTAYRLRMTFLHPAPSVSLSGSFGGCSSPWISPTISGPFGTQVFKGSTYYKYQMDWTAANGAWPCSGPGSPGQLPGGTYFHVGATLAGIVPSVPDSFIIIDTTLFDVGGTALALHPRQFAFDVGTLDTVAGVMNLGIFNVAGTPLLLQNLVMQELPRVLAIEAMVPNAAMVDFTGEPVLPWEGSTRQLVSQATLKGDETLSIPIARIGQPRHINETLTAADCRAQADRFGPGADTTNCRPGTTTDLFPATTAYFTADVIDPNATYWDPERKAYVTGPLASRVYYQVAGRRLDQRQSGIAGGGGNP